MIYQYQRIYIKKQRHSSQESIIENTDMKVDMIFTDTISGTKSDRPQLNKLKEIVKENDVIYCQSISRLGRNLKDVMDICEYFKSKGATVIMLKEDINTDNEDTYKLLMAVHGAVSEMERDCNSQKTRNGVAHCMETGKTKTGRWFGRQEIDKNYILEKYPKFPTYFEMINEKKMNKTQVSKLLGVTRATLYRYIDIYTAS